MILARAMFSETSHETRLYQAYCFSIKKTQKFHSIWYFDKILFSLQENALLCISTMCHRCDYHVTIECVQLICAPLYILHGTQLNCTNWLHLCMIDVAELHINHYSTASACFKCWLVKSPSRDTRYFLQRPVMTFCRSLFDWADRSLFTRARPMDSVLQTRLTRAESASAQLAARVS